MEPRPADARDQLQVTLANIHEGVITTDERGLVQLMNPVAEALTGWSGAEVNGHPIDDIFNLIDEHSREPVENPFDRVLHEGVTLNLANHTLLIGRDGSERAIDDSAAPIKDAAGNVHGIVVVFRDVTDRRKANEVNARLAALVESSEDAIISKNLDGIITSWNSSAQRMFGYSAEEAIGRPIWMLASSSRPHEMQEILSRIRNGERINHFETIRRRRDGVEIHVSLSISPVRDEYGRIIGASKIARDITQRIHADREREALLASEQAARAEAERANHMKDEFLATVSHEIRTPLNAILGWSQLLKTGKLDAAELDEALDIIERNSRAQARLIEDLLDMSRIMSGKLRLDIKPVDLRSIIESVLVSLRPSADAKQIAIEIEYDPSLPSLMADGSRLQQIVWNILSNAIKFTPEHGRIQVRAARIGLKVELVVTDSGQGIAAEFLPYVFDRFRQADSSSHRQHAGLGLGLAIVKQLVEMHGGTIRAESAGPNTGATFRIILPLSARENGPNSDSRLAADRPAESPLVEQSSVLSGLKILVVDDDPDSRQFIARVLKHGGADVVEASSADAAVESVVRDRPNVLLSDIGMPQQDGYALIQRVRSLPRDAGATIPAAALTAMARLEDRVRALRAGFQSHIAKPIDAAELLAMVAALAGRTGQP